MDGCVFGRLCVFLLAFILPQSVSLLTRAAEAPSAGSPLPAFRAGAAEVAIENPPGISLAGYVFRFNPWEGNSPNSHYYKANTGQHDPIRAKAVVLELKGRKFVIVSIDLVGIFPSLRSKVLERIAAMGFSDDDLLMVASHTHSGPGGFVKMKFWEILAVDRFIPSFFERLVESTVKSIQTATANLRPARWAVTQSKLDGFTMNRRNSPTLSPTLTLGKIEDAEARPIATILNFPVHGNLLDWDNQKLSADIPGAIERSVEARIGGTALFLSDAAGDVNPTGFNRDFDGLDRFSEAFAERVIPLYRSLETAVPSRLATIHVQRPLIPPRARLRECLLILGKVGELLRELLPDETRMPAEFAQPLDLRGLRIDDHLFVSVPAEPISELGLAVREQGLRAGLSSVSIIGLANSYMGYILTPAEFARGGYESCNSFYGPNYGLEFLAATDQLIRAAQRGED